MPKADPKTAALFQALLPDDSRVAVRPMFGHTAAFVNGHMIAGTFGTHIFVRLDETSRTELLAMPGTQLFAPMKGRPMKEYVQLPDSLLRERSAARAWVARALEWGATLPPKVSSKTTRTKQSTKPASPPKPRTKR